MICSLCPRKCAALRTESEAQGRCRMGLTPRVARAMLHMWEEPCLSGTRGSGAVFFSGCTMGCLFCQNTEISHGGFGRDISIESLAGIFDDLAAQGAHNINLVSPTQFVHAVIPALKMRKNRLPVIYNTGGYERVETLRALEGHVQIYLPDLKFSSPALAQRICGAPEYFAVATRAIEEMWRQVGAIELDEEGIAQSGLMIRHLVLPGQAEDSKRVLSWIADHLPEDVMVSVMAQYVPYGAAKGDPVFGRRVTEKEFDQVLEHMDKLSLDNGYVQQLDAAEEEYIPDFSLQGVPEK